MNNVCEEDLITYHIEEAQLIFPQIDTKFLSDNLDHRRKIIEEIIQD